MIQYSEYGYVKVYKQDLENKDSKLIELIKDKNFTIGNINKSKISSTIKINLKTLYGERKLYTFIVDVNSLISNLIKDLVDIESTLEDRSHIWDKNHQYRIITTKGYIKELSTNKKVYEEKIKDGDILILSLPIKLGFSETMHGPGIVIESNGALAYKENSEEHQIAFVDKGFNNGRVYCEFTLITEPDERNIIFGVSLARPDYYFPQDFKHFWGFVPSELKKISNINGEPQNVDYGDVCKLGDKIGILLEFNEKGLDISFFVNKLDLNVAFKSLPLTTYYPCAVLLYEGAKVKVSNRVPLPYVIKE